MRFSNGFRKLAKGMCIFVLFSFVLLMPGGALWAEDVWFKDIRGHWAEETIEWAAENGIAYGYEDGTFRPDRLVSEPEFLALLLRAFPEIQIGQPKPQQPWYAPYYEYAQKMGWPIIGKADPNRYNRGHAARLIAATQKGPLPLKESIQYLLDEGLSNGKTAPTIAGYQAGDGLTRAEAVQFIRNFKAKGFQIGAKAGEGTSFTVAGVKLGDSEQELMKKLGQPARKDPSEYQFEWYIYNRDYKNVVQVGVYGGKVMALFSPSDNWMTDKGIKMGSKRSDVLEAYGTLSVETDFSNHQIGKASVTFFYDAHRNHAVDGILVISEEAKPRVALAGYQQAGSNLAAAFERQIFDLANATRVKFGLSPFVWDDKAAASARAHSADMAAKGYFDHYNLDGKSPFDRMEARGIQYTMAAENIAAGYRNAIHVHYAWMNSPGHRSNLLGQCERLGVGVAFGGAMHVYYTQNFFTP